MTYTPDWMQNWMIEQDMKDLIDRDYFLIEKLKTYLLKEKSDGKIEFRIAMQSDDHIIIHPLGKDGGTLDLHFTPTVKSQTK